MPRSYERVETRRRQTYAGSAQRTTWGHWVPLAITVTVATAGIVAWIWNERKDDDDEDYSYRPPPPGQGGPPPPGYYGGQPPQQGPGFDPAASGTYPGGSFSGPPPPPGSFPGAPGYGPPGENRAMAEDDSIMSKMSGALRRTPSPQQLLDGASRRVAAGVAAAGAAVGGALASIREEGPRGDYEDHSRWSEEADSQNGRRGPELRDSEAVAAAAKIAKSDTKQSKKSGKKQRAVAVVISAETTHHEYDEDPDYHEEENASILAHLPTPGPDSPDRVFILIYDPSLKQHPLSSSAPNSPPTQPGAASPPDKSMSSSYSNITPSEAPSRTFTRLYNQALPLIPSGDATCIMPFSTPTGYVHMLRHLAPETVYIQATTTLTGAKGTNIFDGLQSWVGQIVLVVGDESGHGGLVDSEEDTAAHAPVEERKWWSSDSRIGLGKGVEVVEGLRIGQDWKRRLIVRA